MKTNDFVNISHQLFLSVFPAPNMNKVTCHTLWLKKINSHINILPSGHAEMRDCSPMRC